GPGGARRPGEEQYRRPLYRQGLYRQPLYRRPVCGGRDGFARASGYQIPSSQLVTFAPKTASPDRFVVARSAAGDQSRAKTALRASDQAASSQESTRIPFTPSSTVS